MLYMRGTRKRVLFKNEEEKQLLKIRRLYCTPCKRIHHELPDCIVPYKRYNADTIKNIIDGQSKNQDACSGSTAERIRKWWRILLPYFLHILQNLTERYGINFGKPPAFKEMVRAVTNTNNWIFPHQFCTRSAMRPG
jgi:hypothetical protein